jgi:HD superfamily phosphodiesterase
MTPDEQACLDALHVAEGRPDGPMARHSERVFLLAEKLAGGQDIDRELLRCACYLHDIGLFEPVDGHDAYVTEGRRYAERLLAHWEPDRLRRCADAVEFHHASRSQESKGLEVELVRRADRIEVSQALDRQGLDRAVIREIRQAVPVRGFTPAVLRLLGRHALRRPGSLPGIFRAGGRAR